LAVAAALLFGAAAGFGPTLAHSQPARSGAPAPAADSPSSASDAIASGYVLGPEDKLRVIVFGEESLSGEFLISGSGKVSLPLIGEVKAAGLTVRQFQDEVQNALKDGYLKDPRVSAEVLNFRPYYILGEVTTPGRYPYTDGLTVVKAVAAAGGFTYRAKSSRVFIKRNTDQKEQEYDLQATTPVMPGDTIRIPERLF
jgi:polysaccharide export outer membrane protein